MKSGPRRLPGLLQWLAAEPTTRGRHKIDRRRIRRLIAIPIQGAQCHAAILQAVGFPSGSAGCVAKKERAQHQQTVPRAGQRAGNTWPHCIWKQMPHSQASRLRQSPEILRGASSATWIDKIPRRSRERSGSTAPQHRATKDAGAASARLPERNIQTSATTQNLPQTYYHQGFACRVSQNQSAAEISIPPRKQQTRPGIAPGKSCESAEYRIQQC